MVASATARGTESSQLTRLRINSAQTVPASSVEIAVAAAAWLEKPCNPNR